MEYSQERKLTAENRQFTFLSQPKFSIEDGSEGKRKRKFSGTAYSGGAITNHWYWGNVVFDLDTMSVPSKLPALIDHARSQRCGYVTDSKISNESGFEVSGNLLSNAYGTSVASESDEGFPWQMSVHIEPESIEEVRAGSIIAVNGRDLPGPIVVFRNSKIIEVSFTATGWDSNTSAAAMSRGGDSSPTPQGEINMDLKQIQDRVAALEAENKSLQSSKDELSKQLKEASDNLAKFTNEVRTQAVKSLFEDLGREYKADDAEVKVFSSMPQEAFDATSKVMREQFKKSSAAPGLPNNLFQHSATGSNGQGSQNSQDAENPLMKDAKKRSEQFKRS